MVKPTQILTGLHEAQPFVKTPGRKLTGSAGIKGKPTNRIDRADLRRHMERTIKRLVMGYGEPGETEQEEAEEVEEAASASDDSDDSDSENVLFM